MGSDPYAENPEYDAAVERAWEDWREHWLPKADLMCVIAGAMTDSEIVFDLDGLAEQIECSYHEHFGGDMDIDFPSLLDLAVERARAHWSGRGQAALEQARDERNERQAVRRSPLNFSASRMQQMILDAARRPQP